MRFSLFNLGCKVNQVELEQLAARLLALGYSYLPEETLKTLGVVPDFAIINTCTVTEKADRKAFALIKKWAKEGAVRQVVVTGCYSELEKNLMQQLRASLGEKPAGKVMVVRQRDKMSIPERIDALLRQAYGYSNHVADYENKWQAFKGARNHITSLQQQPVEFVNHTRAFIKIQDGCNAFCSYCRIPFARGAPVSRPYRDLMQQIDQLLAHSFVELVFCGINLGMYLDKATGNSFIDLVQATLEKLAAVSIKERGAKRLLRISSLEPHSITPAFIALTAHPNFAPHLHLPVQATSERLLRVMRRRYTLADFKALVRSLYALNPRFAISTDVITAYPDETEAEFEAGKHFLQEVAFSKLHVFPFSARPLTQSYEALTTELPVPEKKRRVKALQLLSKQLEAQQLKKLIGVRQRLVLEQEVFEEKKIASSPSPFNFSLYRYFKSTSEYYLKGLTALLKKEVAHRRNQGRLGALGEGSLLEAEVKPPHFMANAPFYQAPLFFEVVA